MSVQSWLDERAAKKMAEKTATWPTALAKLQEAELNFDDGPAVTFAYSYEANGEFYSAEGKLWCKNADDAQRRGEALCNAAQFPIRYSPLDPSQSWVDPAVLRALTGN